MLGKKRQGFLGGKRFQHSRSSLVRDLVIECSSGEHLKFPSFQRCGLLASEADSERLHNDDDIFRMNTGAQRSSMPGERLSFVGRQALTCIIVATFEKLVRAQRFSAKQRSISAHTKGNILVHCQIAKHSEKNPSFALLWSDTVTPPKVLFIRSLLSETLFAFQTADRLLSHRTRC